MERNDRLIRATLEDVASEMIDTNAKSYSCKPLYSYRRKGLVIFDGKTCSFPLETAELRTFMTFYILSESFTVIVRLLDAGYWDFEKPVKWVV